MFRLALRFAAIVASAALAVPALAQPEWGRAPRVEVKLDSFSYTPSSIHLRAGQPVVLHLVNVSSGGHDFDAPAFFAAASLREPGAVERGRIELAGHESRDIALVPRAGRYALKCTHAFHKMFGMSGEIVVD
jgi:plastocyanin